MNKITSILFIPLILACNNTAQQIETIQLTKKTTVLSLQTELNMELFYSNFIDSINYIRLQSPEHIIIGNNVYKIIYTKNKFYVFDENQVFVFEQNGDYAYNIGTLGDGPGEINYPNDFYIDTTENTIEILSLGNQKIVRYDMFDGHFINEFQLKFYATNFHKTNFGEYLFHGEHPNPRSRKYLNSLISSDSNGKSITSSVPYPTYLEQYTGKAGNRFSQLSEGILYSRMLDNNIYQIKDGNIEVKYRLDFGKNNIEINKDLVRRYEYLSDIMDNTDYAVHFSAHFANDRFFLYRYYLNHKRINLFYNIKYDQLLSGDKIKNDVDYGPKPFIVGLNDNSLIGIVQPSKFINHVEKIKKDPELWAKYQKKHPKIFNLYNSVNEYDNPILMICYLKDKFDVQ